ncbi:elongation of very long chain fatty acids protein [Nesidiocoris tenuis]|nr:elongation of very long chain fatty acids protein [Nesidiocoris tenuis]
MYRSYYEFWDKHSDPRSKHLPLMGDPLPIVMVIGVYMYFISILGPRLMKNRAPMQLNRFMHCYNAVQVVANAMIVYKVFHLVWIPWKYNFWCDGIETTDENFGKEVAYACYYYFVLKILDFVDTMIMVLRKKDSQVSFLHKYHHVMICVGAWVGAAIMPGGPHEALFATMNCSIHVIMYSYYSATIFNPELRNCKYKRHLTEIQLVQFAVAGIHAVVGYFQPNCTFPKWAFLLFVPQDVFMICMFLDFYIKAYVKPKQLKKKQRAE